MGGWECGGKEGCVLSGDTTPSSQVSLMRCFSTLVSIHADTYLYMCPHVVYMQTCFTHMSAEIHTCIQCHPYTYQT